MQVNEQLRREIRLLQEKLHYLNHQRFGRKSEQLDGQPGLFGTEPVDPTEIPAEDTLDTQPQAPERKKGGRRRPPADLPRVRIEHDLPDEQKRCTCGCERDRIGEEISEQYDVEPPRFRILQHVRYTYACPRCDQGIECAPKAPDPLPRSQVSPGMLAWIGSCKYVDGLPLHRQSVILERRFGVTFTTTTLAQWMIQSAERVLKPLAVAMEVVLRGCDYLHADETTLQVLDELGRYAWQKSYLWVRATGSGPPIILLDYHASRAGAVADKLLGGFAGYLQIDGYSGYNGPAGRDEITVLGCWAHARRKFDAAIKAAGRLSRQGVLAQEALELIAQLYRIEKDARGLEPEQKQQRREQMSLAVLEKLRRWLDNHIDEAAALGGALAKACGYMNNQWPRLVRFVDDPRLRLDNNRVENHIRPIAVGRKNWLFCKSPEGAHASALWYSVVETAKANGWEPYHYLKWLFAELPARLQQGLSLEPLLPWVAAPQRFGDVVN
jgi:transposase